MIKNVWNKLKDHDHVFTVTQVDVKYHPSKQFSVGENGIARRTNENLQAPPNRQSLEPTFIRNGAVYGFRVDSFLKTKSILGSSPYALVIDEPLVNIDTLEDLQRAEEFFSNRTLHNF